ncbi:hybrid sensor histidine kinase/response regulator [Aliterella atlantica]|uniref:histidine kinase n=1 Tax=Aliterella atlantica CENA595 TaxID=1618023 RepID=A0A0D8ZRC3_9CYAN|nr:PAS domain-containing sensor histidine kinase [Aliterella atlantica]KJH70902.1 hypothetical protein UH38_14995 [Aliterella atlantica CENA595]
MTQILLLLENQQNLRLLAELLSTSYQVLVTNKKPQAEQFDLCILDGKALDRHWEWVQARKADEEPVYLPFLLITSRQDVSIVTRHLWRSMDELITKPIEKIELQARVEILLRSRKYSQQLLAANHQLQVVAANLSASEAKFRSLVNNSSDAIAVVKEDGVVVYASPSSRTIFGFSPQELEGKNVFDFIHPDDLSSAIAPFRASLINPDKTQVSEYRFRHKDGSWRYLESKSNFSHTALQSRGIVVTSRDITQRKQAEADIINALQTAQELSELKTRFVSMVSHEIRNPLNSISTAAQLLERYGEKWDRDKKQDFFQRIKVNVKLLTELLEDVLLIGKVEAGKLEIQPTLVEIESFCNDLLEEVKLNVDGSHQLIFTSEGRCTNAYIDKKILRHILYNLIANAIKYSPPGSKVCLEVFCCEEGFVFKVKDNGIGIPLENQKHLFESFYRADNARNISGTGLGLFIVKKYVDISGGNISVESEIGVGSTFTVTLPLNTEANITRNYT